MKQIWRVITFTRELWRYYALVSIFTILLAAMSQLQPLFTKGAIDQISKLTTGGNPDMTLVIIFALAIFISDFAATIFSNIGGHIGDLLMIKQQRMLSERYFKHLLKLPQQYFDSELSGTIINRMSRGITQISQFTQMMSNNFLQFIFSTIFSLAIVFYYSWQVGLMLSLLYPVFIWLTTRTSSRWQTYQTIINHEQDSASGRFAEAIGQVKVVKSYLQEKREQSIFSKHFNTAVETTRPQSIYWHKQDMIRRTVLNVIFLAIFAYIFIEAARGVYSIGTMVLLIQYAQLIRIPIFSISFLVDQTQRTISNTKDYFEAMDEEPAIVDAPGAKKLAITDAAVAFKDVKFAYTDGDKVLKGVTFDLPADSKTALVGESGEGKTTITSLLLRLYTVDSGAITIDGQDITSVTQGSLRKQIAVVFQEPALFSGSVRENIAYANPHATETEIIAAAKAANAHEFISKFEKGYDSQIGERGLKLSGGQKQRLAIARALLKDAPILILDEATSSLDSRSEGLVQDALARLMKGRTTLIIAHRLSTIHAVDQIVTIKGGRVDEVGSPAELAKTQGIYAQLLELQSQASEINKKKLKNFEISG